MLKDITLGQYFPGNSFIHKLDPRTKILIMIAYVVLVFIVQNFYGDQFAEVAIRPEATTGIESLSDDECHLFTYVPDVKKVHEYTRLLGECATAHDLAGVVSIMLSEPRVGKDTVVKGTFIEVLLPFASRLTSGAKVDNVRQQINNMLMRQGRGGK